jgi:sugar phosphate isomerase/epimerase
MKSPLAGHTNSYHTYSFEEALDGIAKAGFKGVELSAVPGWTEHVSLDKDPAKVRSEIERRGLVATVLSAHSDLTTQEGLEHGLKGLKWAARYGLPVMVTAVGGHQSASESEAAFFANLPALTAAAASAGVIVALEIHGDIMASGERSLPLIEKIGSEWVRVNYDTANVEYYSGRKAVDDLSAIVPYLAHVHLKDHKGGKGDWYFPACGEGNVDFARVLEILKASGYSGGYSVETEFSGEPWPPLAEVDRSMKSSYKHLSTLGFNRELAGPAL